MNLLVAEEKLWREVSEAARLVAKTHANVEHSVPALLYSPPDGGQAVGVALVRSSTTRLLTTWLRSRDFGTMLADCYFVHDRALGIDPGLDLMARILGTNAAVDILRINRYNCYTRVHLL